MKRIKEDSRGSILILVMLALVGAISIAVAMSSISIVERKITTKSRKSTTAFQSANSGIEWAMKKINDAGPDDTINSVFGNNPNGDGQINCPANSFFSNGSGLSCKITFLKRDPSNGQRIPISNVDAPIEDIIAIRSAGTFGTDTEKVGRALEAYAMPNCGSSMERVADFCIDDGDKDLSSGQSWADAVSVCQSGGKRLCTAAELVAANQSSPIGSELFSADVTNYSTDGEYAAVDNGEISRVVSDADVDSVKFRCCRNR